MTDYLYGGLLAVALIVSTFFIGKLSNRAVNPVLVHNLAWALGLGTYSLHWIYYTNVTFEAWVLITLGIATFNIGALVPLLGDRRDTQQRFTQTPLRWATISLPVLFLLGLAIYLHSVAAQFGLSTLIHNPTEIRAFQGTNEFGATFPLYGRLLYFLGPLVFILYANPKVSGIRVPKLVRIGVLGMTVVGLALSLERTLLLVTFVWQGAIFLVRPRQRTAATSVRRFAIVAAAALFTIIAFQILGVVTQKAEGNDTRIQPYVAHQLRGKNYTSLFTYASGGVPAFSQLTTDPTLRGRYSDGEATFGPVAKVIPGLSPPNQVGAFASIPFPQNSYTWLETYYRDFGPFGCVLLPFAMGLIVSVGATRRRFDSETLLVGALLIGLCAWAPLVNQYPSTFTWEYVAVLLLARRQRILRRPRASPETTTVVRPPSPAR